MITLICVLSAFYETGTLFYPVRQGFFVSCLKLIFSRFHEYVMSNFDWSLVLLAMGLQLIKKT